MANQLSPSSVFQEGYRRIDHYYTEIELLEYCRITESRIDKYVSISCLNITGEHSCCSTVKRVLRWLEQSPHDL